MPKKYTHLIVDEAQDLSRLELALLNRWAKQCQSLIMVGDPYQNLYEWRGTEPNGFNTLAADVRILKQSYRVPDSVHGLATAWIRGLSNYELIEYYPTNKKGTVGTISHENVIKIIQESCKNGKTVRLIGSNNRLLGNWRINKNLKRLKGFRITTIHGAKGREADVVILLTNISRASSAVWHGYDKAKKDSIYREFYVAITRAKENLYICYDEVVGGDFIDL